MSTALAEPFRSHWPSTCPRCGISHSDAPERARADALCRDCRLYGPGWAQQARNEIARLAKPPDTTYRCGHPKTDGNTYIRPDGRGRMCLTCKRKRSRRSS